MCKYGDTVLLDLEISAELSCIGTAYIKTVAIDVCIAPIVRALNVAGIKTKSSCCGHGKSTGNIFLADGRILEIIPNVGVWGRLLPINLETGNQQDGPII